MLLDGSKAKQQLFCFAAIMRHRETGCNVHACCFCMLAGSEAEYKAMRVLCLVATVDDDPQCAVAAQVRRRVECPPHVSSAAALRACCTCHISRRFAEGVTSVSQQQLLSTHQLCRLKAPCQWGPPVQHTPPTGQLSQPATASCACATKHPSCAPSPVLPAGRCRAGCVHEAACRRSSTAGLRAAGGWQSGRQPGRSAAI